MRLFAGATTLVAGVLGVLFVIWRITTGVESWFITSGAGDVLMWSLVIALVMTVFAIPLGAYGIAARMWLVRMEHGQYLESTPHALRSSARPRMTAAHHNLLPDQQQLATLPRAELIDTKSEAGLRSHLSPAPTPDVVRSYTR